MEQKDILEEVPLSNSEVLKVLKAKTSINQNSKCSEILKYLQSIPISNKYSLELLRDLKTQNILETDLLTLAMVSNISDLSILKEQDRNTIELHLRQN